MTRLRRIWRYFALRTYETRQGWRYFKNDVVEFLQYWCFRIKFRRAKSWPFRVLARLLSRRVPKAQGFGEFGEKAELMCLPADHPIFDPKNDRLFSKEAALKAFRHVNVDDEKMRARGTIIESLLPADVMDYGHEGGMALDKFLANQDTGSLPPTAENLAAIKAGKEELCIPAQLAEAVAMLKAKKAQRIERWKTVFAVSAGAAGVVGFLIAMAALYFAR